MRTISTLCIVMCSILVATGQPMPDRHSSSIGDAWLSCTTSANPNPIRPASHWLRIDLGDTYALQSSTIWNFNTPERINSYGTEAWSFAPLQGKLTDGMKDVVIDLSVDGSTWIEWGRFTIPKANGYSTYEGSMGPSFDGKLARYILITGQSNHGGTCYGLSEVRVKGSIATISNTNDVLTNAKMTAEPNPFSATSLISLAGFPDGKTLVVIRDIAGREVERAYIQISQGVGTYQMDSEQLETGLYMLTATTGNAVKTLKVEVIR